MTPAQSVVLVEDNPADARLLQEMVAGAGDDFVLRPCRRLQEALAQVQRTATDCVLLDLSLPDTDGLDGVATLRARFPDMPIVIITGLDDQQVAVEALQAGVQDYLVKGRIEGDGLRRAVRYAIERKSAEDELARLGRQNELILDSAGEGICGLDADGRMSFVNPAAAQLLGRARSELLGRDLHAVVHGRAEDGAAHTPAECPINIALRERRAHVSDDELFWRADGASFPVEYTTNPIVTGQTLEGAVVTFRDITDRKRVESQLQYLAEHDVLTGLYNRRRFGEELTRQINLAGRYDLGSALLVLDIDNFKFVNDALGHAAGDELIRSLAGQVRSRLRGSDVVARLGGDEFAVLLAGADGDAAMALAGELLDLVRGHTVMARKKPLRVTTSIGVTLIDGAELTGEQLLMEADVAMYEAKSAGRDRSVLFQRDTDALPQGQPGFVWTDRIKRALDEDRLVVYGQPIVDLTGDSARRFELLVRMVQHEEEVVPPGAFLPVAERFGLIGSIDAWMVRQAASLIESEQAAGRELVLEVNLSGHSIGDPMLSQVIEAELAFTEIDPSSLVFEITETAAISNMDEARKLADRVREWGCRFALDDFGAGFGSFCYLKYLPLDYLKIDGEFIRNVERSEVDQRMVKAMVEIARGLRLRTIAEFVESAETLEHLRGYGVDFVQGHHVGRPAPIERLLG